MLVLQMMRTKSQRAAAFTLLELLCVTATIIILLGMILPTRNRRHNSTRIKCINNLKNIGIAYRIWAVDNNDQFSFHVSTNNSGSLELRHDIALQFRILSNELSTPKILICPGEKPVRVEATNWPALRPSNISYFIGFAATERPPHSTAALSGDSAFHLNDARVPSGLIRLRPTDKVTFPKDLCHKTHSPNFLLGDGSIHFATANSIMNTLLGSSCQTNTLLIP